MSNARVSERQEDGSYRVVIEGDPASEQVVWGTYLYWARRFDLWDQRFELKQALLPTGQPGLSVEEGGCSFSLYPHLRASTAALLLKLNPMDEEGRMAKVVSVQKILGPLFDGSYRTITADPQVNEYVWGTCEYWAKKLKLTDRLEELRTAFEGEKAPDISVQEEGKKRQIYHEAIARKVAQALQGKLKQEAQRARFKLN